MILKDMVLSLLESIECVRLKSVDILEYLDNKLEKKRVVSTVKVPVISTVDLEEDFDDVVQMIAEKIGSIVLKK